MNTLPTDLDLSHYKCVMCGAEGVKLWRPYQTSHIELYCCECLQQHVGRRVDFNPDGYYEDVEFGRCCSLEWYVPAVPTDSCGVAPAYWGYCSVPKESVEWWEKLPLGTVQRQLDAFVVERDGDDR